MVDETDQNNLTEKEEADIQRGKQKPQPKKGETKDSTLLEIREALYAQNENLLGEAGPITGELQAIRKHLTSLIQLQLKNNELTLDNLDLDRKLQQDDTVDKLQKMEDDNDLLTIFKEMRGSLQYMVDDIEEAKGEGGGLFGWLSLRTLSKSAGGIGLGISGVLLGFGGMIAMLAGGGYLAQFTDGGKKLGELIGNVGKGFNQWNKQTLMAFGGLTAIGATMAILPGGGIGIKRAGKLASIMTGMGVGISGFFAGFVAGAATLTAGEQFFKTADYDQIEGAAASFNRIVGILGTGDQQALKVVGGMIAGTGLFAAFAPMKMSLKAAAGMAIGPAAIGAGISGFFMGLTTFGEIAPNWSADGSELMPIVENFTKMIGMVANQEHAFTVIGSLIGGGAFLGAVAGGAMRKFPIGTTLAAIGALTGVGIAGAGIGSFFSGIALGGTPGALIAMTGIDIGGFMSNLAEGLGAFVGKDFSGLFAMGGIFATIGAVGGGLALPTAGVSAIVAGAAAVGAATGMGIAGAGIGMFFSGLALTTGLTAWMTGGGVGIKNLLVNMAEGLESMSKLDGYGLFQTSMALLSLGPAMLAFFGSKGLLWLFGKVGDTGEWLADKLVFWKDLEDKPEDNPIYQMVQALQPLEDMPDISGKGLSSLEHINDMFTSLGTRSFNGDRFKRNVDLAAEGILKMASINELIVKGGTTPSWLNGEPYELAGVINLQGMDEAANELERILNLVTIRPQFAMPGGTLNQLQFENIDLNDNQRQGLDSSAAFFNTNNVNNTSNSGNQSVTNFNYGFDQDTINSVKNNNW